MIISICTDVAALKEHDSIKIVDDESPAARNKILSTGGTNIFYNGNSSIVCLTGLEGLEALADLDYVVITSYEEIFGYKRQASDENGLLWEEAYTVTPAPYIKYTDNYVDTGEIDELESPIYVNDPTEETITPEPYEQIDPTMELIAPIAEMKALYDSIYTRTPVTTDLGTYTPPALMGIPGGYDISHLSTGE